MGPTWEVVRRMPKQAAPWILIVPAFLFVTAFSPATALAEGGRIRVSTELDYLATNADTRNKLTGEETETDRSYFLQLYNLEIQKELYPYLFFRTGGLLKLTESTTTRVSEAEGKERSDFDERLGRVFAELDLNNPLYTAGASYHWSELKETNADTERLFREEYDGRLRWRPEGFPSFDLEYSRLHLYDDPKTRDLLDDRLKFESRYDYEDFSSDYTYTRLDNEEKFADSGSLTQIHDGGMRYSDSFFGDRVSMAGSVRLRYSTLEPSGAGDFKLATDPPTGLFSVPDDLSPELTDPGDYRPLGDGRIGVVFPGDVGKPVSFGLDFAFDTEIDTIYVLPNQDARELASLDWDIYVSDDRVNWVLVDPTLYDVSSTYNAGYDRFEISFPPFVSSFPLVSAQYIKVITNSQLTIEEIGVAQLEAFTSVPGSEGLKIKDFVQNYNLGLRWQITDKTTTSYDGFYRRQESQPFDEERTTLTNGIRLQHIFSPVFVGSARAMRTDGTSSEQGDVVNHLYSASLRANYLDTLNQTLVYSGRHQKDKQGSGTTDSIFLRTNADLYRDWSMNLDLGYTWTKPIEDVSDTTALLRVGTDVAPNEKLRFVMNYLARWRTEKGEATELDQNASLQAFWVPFRTVSLFGRVNLRHRKSEGGDLTVSQNYSFIWAPFPDGSLNFSVAYNQILDTRDTESRIFSPQVEWQITRNALLTVRFNIGTIESEREESDVRNLRAELRVFY